jgi:putative tricarboxylic transport membrane protein
MTLRADHVAGAFFIGLGALVFALSGDLPTGSLSMPGSGFLPKILAGLSILFGIVLILRARESRPFTQLQWVDGKHAALVVAITAAGIAVFDWLGFLITMVVLMFALLVFIERRNVLYAGIYSLGVVLLTYVIFVYVLKTPLPIGPFGF